MGRAEGLDFLPPAARGAVDHPVVDRGLDSVPPRKTDQRYEVAFLSGHKLQKRGPVLQHAESGIPVLAKPAIELVSSTKTQGPCKSPLADEMNPRCAKRRPKPLAKMAHAARIERLNRCPNTRHRGGLDAPPGGVDLSQ